MSFCYRELGESITGLMGMYGVYHLLPPLCRQLLSGLDGLRT